MGGRGWRENVSEDGGWERISPKPSEGGDWRVGTHRVASGRPRSTGTVKARVDLSVPEVKAYERNAYLGVGGAVRGGESLGDRGGAHGAADGGSLAADRGAGHAGLGGGDHGGGGGEGKGGHLLC